MSNRDNPQTLYSSMRRLFRGYVLGNAFERAALKWFRDKGDETLRLNYPLDSDSTVFDCGGYEGDWAAAIHERYGCKVFVFEPVNRYAEAIEKRFRGNSAVRTFRYGLHCRNETTKIHLAANASSTFGSSAEHEEIQLRDVAEVFNELGAERIHLIKINIEGGEFDLLERLLDTKLIERIDDIQVQFHKFVPDAVERRRRIRENLSRSHRLSYDYEFIWESWSRTNNTVDTKRPIAPRPR